MNSASIAPGTRPSQGPELPARVLLFISLTVILGLLGQALTATGATTFGDVDWGGLVLLAVLILLAELFSADIGASHTSVSAVILLAVSFLYGLPGNLVAAAVFVAAGQLDRHPALYKSVFNFGNVLLASAGATATLQMLVAGLGLEPSFSQLLVPSAIAGLVFYVLNHLFLCLVRGLAEDRSPLAIWRADFEWLSAHYAALGVVGMLLALVYLNFGWAGVIGLSAPVGMMQYAMRQYVNRTTALVADLRQTNEQLTESHNAILEALSRALDTRDEETEEHSQRVCRYAELIGREHGLSADALEDLRAGALLHDLGKIGVPDAVLLKPGALTEEEWALVRKHPEIGYSMISDIPFLQRAAEVVLHHHERYDGTGYPARLVGEAIPLNARIFAVADTLDAMCSDRPYRRGLAIEVALHEIEHCAGTQFDPAVVRSLLAIDLARLVAARDDRAVARPSIPLATPVTDALPGEFVTVPS